MRLEPCEEMRGVNIAYVRIRYDVYSYMCACSCQLLPCCAHFHIIVPTFADFCRLLPFFAVFLPRRDSDGKVSPEEVAAAVAFLKHSLGDDPVKELIGKLAKDSGASPGKNKNTLFFFSFFFFFIFFFLFFSHHFFQMLKACHFFSLLLSYFLHPRCLASVSMHRHSVVYMTCAGDQVSSIESKVCVVRI